jgi:hypothetical protein
MLNISYEALFKATYEDGERILYGRESSLEGDSLDEEEEGNIQGRGLEELLG